MFKFNKKNISPKWLLFTKNIRLIKMILFKLNFDLLRFNIKFFIYNTDSKTVSLDIGDGSDDYITIPVQSAKK